jgi:hypothetical protein
MTDKPIAPQRGFLSFTVQNSNLSYVRQALILGQYTSSTLTGTEAVVDLLIGGTMAEALAMGCYHDRPGSCSSTPASAIALSKSNDAFR